MPPLWFFVDCGVCDASQRADHPAVDSDGARRDSRAGRLVHERHELVREAGHRAADADASDIRTTADASHPPALCHVAVDNRTPTAELHDALWRSVVIGEIALFVVTRAVAPFVYSLAKQPRGSQVVIKGNQRSQCRRLIEKIKQRLHEVVGLNGTSGYVYDWNPRL